MSRSLALFTVAPAQGGVEASYPGYARQTVADNVVINRPRDRYRFTSIDVSFPTVPEAAGTMDCAVLFDGAGNVLETRNLVDEIELNPGVVPVVSAYAIR